MQTLSANVNDNIVTTNAVGVSVPVAFNDIYLDGDRNISVSFGLQAALQACAQAASTLLGEMVLNTDQGIPNFQTLWIGVPNIQQWTAALRSAWLAVPTVVEVVSLITSQIDNDFSYTAVIRTTDGTGGISG